MIEFQKKKRIRKVVYSPLTLIVLFILCGFTIRGLWSVYTKEQTSSLKLEMARTELSKLVEREKTLANSIEYLKTEEGIEGEIRTKFRAAKEGENIAVLLEEEGSTSTDVSSTTPEVRGFWYNLFH